MVVLDEDYHMHEQNGTLNTFYQRNEDMKKGFLMGYIRDHLDFDDD